MNEQPKQSVSESISHLPAQILLSLARNPSSSPEYVRAAVQILHDRSFPEANHPDLRMVLLDIKRQHETKAEVEALVESATEEPMQSPALRASVTTATLQQEPVIRNAEALGEDALVGE